MSLSQLASLVIDGLVVLLGSQLYTESITLMKWFLECQFMPRTVNDVFGTLLLLFTSANFVFVEKCFDIVKIDILKVHKDPAGGSSSSSSSSGVSSSYKLLHLFEEQCAHVFEENKCYRKAYGCFHSLHLNPVAAVASPPAVTSSSSSSSHSRRGDDDDNGAASPPSPVMAATHTHAHTHLSDCARVIHLWASEGYAAEYPLFFARAYTHTLLRAAPNHSTAAGAAAAAVDANTFFTLSASYLKSFQKRIAGSSTNSASDGAGDDVPELEYEVAAAMEVYNLIDMINDLLQMPSGGDPSKTAGSGGGGGGGVNKKLVFTLLMERYQAVLRDLDGREGDRDIQKMLTEVGKIYFGITPPSSSRGAANGSAFNIADIMKNMFS